MNFYMWDAQRTRHISLIALFFATWRNIELKSLFKSVLKVVIYALFILYFLHFFKGYVNFRKWFSFLLAKLQGKFISSQRNKQKK